MNFTTVKNVTIPEGVVKKITDAAGNVLWKSGPDYVYVKLINRTLSGEYTNDSVESIGRYAFCYCSALTTVNFPAATSIDRYAFSYCSALTTANFPAVTSIDRYAFSYCSGLISLILQRETMCTLSNKNAFTGTPVASGTGYIYVPRVLVDSYKAATNWSTYSNQFRAIEDYPDICGGESV